MIKTIVKLNTCNFLLTKFIRSQKHNLNNNLIETPTYYQPKLESVSYKTVEMKPISKVEISHNNNKENKEKKLETVTNSKKN